MKVNITFDDDLVKRIDNYATRNYMSRTSLVTLACNQFLNQSELTIAIKDMALAMRRIADLGTIDDGTMKQLEDIEQVINLLYGN